MLGVQNLIDYAGTITYVGVSASGTAQDAERWAITKIEHNASGDVISVTRAGGSADEAFAWSDRDELEYA